MIISLLLFSVFIPLILLPTHLVLKLVKVLPRNKAVNDIFSTMYLSQFIPLILYRFIREEGWYDLILMTQVGIPEVIITSVIGYLMTKLYRKPLLFILHLVLVIVAIQLILTMPWVEDQSVIDSIREIILV